MEKRSKKNIGAKTHGRAQPLLIVKSPRTTGFSTADEDIPFVSIASLQSNYDEENLLGSATTGRNDYGEEDAVAGEMAGSNRSDAGSSQSGSPASRMRGSFLLSASASLDSNVVAQELNGQDVDATPADKARMELGELVVSVLQSHDQAEGKDDDGYGVFESYFDLTRPRLKFIFHTLDQLCTAKAAGVVDYDHLKQGLRDAGIDVRDSESFNRLLQIVDQDLDGGITFNEFETVIQSIKMAHLFREQEKSPTDVPNFRCLNYNVAKCDPQVITNDAIGEFMYSPRQEAYPQRWIHVATPASFTLKALSIKYRIHPLAVEDALMNDQHIRAKVDSYDNHLFLVLPVLSIKVRSSADQVLSEKESQLLKSKYGSVRLTRRYDSSRIGKNSNQSYTSIGSEDHSEDYGDRQSSGRFSKDLKYRVPKLNKYNAFVYVSRPMLNTVISVVDDGPTEIFKRARKELSISYSRLRAYDSMYLTYTLIDEIVDSYAPILVEFEKALMHVRGLVREKPKRFFHANDTSTQQVYHDLTREVTMMKRWVLPVQRVLSHLLEDDLVDPDCKVYLRDVQDHLFEVLDDVSSILEGCRALKDEHMQLIETKMTSTMNGLTIVATAFLPGQFLTGVFGMNFEDMPELHWRYGYPLFWIICIASWIALFGFFKSQNYI